MLWYLPTLSHLILVFNTKSQGQTFAQAREKKNGLMESGQLRQFWFETRQRVTHYTVTNHLGRIFS